jgi:hypothetical protein
MSEVLAGHPDRAPDHIYDFEQKVWLLGGLPIADGVVDAQGCNMMVDPKNGLHLFYIPNAADLAARAEEEAVCAAVDAARAPSPAQVAQAEQDMAALKEWAAKDPAVAALLRRTGIVTE